MVDVVVVVVEPLTADLHVQNTINISIKPYIRGKMHFSLTRCATNVSITGIKDRVDATSKLPVINMPVQQHPKIFCQAKNSNVSSCY